MLFESVPDKVFRNQIVQDVRTAEVFLTSV